MARETAPKEWAARPVPAPKVRLCWPVAWHGIVIWMQQQLQLLAREKTVARREARVGVPANRCASLPGVAARRVLRGERRACWGAQAFNLPGYNSNRLIIPVVDHSR